MPLYKNGSFVQDPWSAIPEGEAISPAGHVIVPLSWWQAERQAFAGSNVPIGVRIDPGTPIEEFLEDLSRFALIALAIPKFQDGRAYSTARLLRERHGFKGELRAIGEVLIDQIQPLLRCGFDAFEITDPVTQAALEAGRVPGVTHFYQPGVNEAPQAGVRPWLRQAGR